MCYDSLLGRFRLFHRWLKYEQPTVVHTDKAASVVVQRRKCLCCGAIQYRRVSVEN